MDGKTLGKRIALLRGGRTQTELARTSGVSLAILNRLENGKNKNPTKATLEKIARGLRVTTRDLIDESFEVSGAKLLSAGKGRHLPEDLGLLVADLEAQILDARKIAQRAEKTAQKALAKATGVPNARQSGRRGRAS